ncbi:unnamed protein product [Sphenostylis stenocarpa]|uniref:Uncharacterized protein n=1 Tax=Sphenostylis stenocarpa TaxID=92480 RepID=A0AA86RWS8_9FABA|nr:unnamed protein product [Sphenostylis stenocarpa]
MAGKSSITQPAARHGTNKLTKYDIADLEWTNRIPECPTYYPSEHEFDHPLVYLQKIAPEASKYGIPSSCVEKEFWHEMTHGEKGTVEYGVNVEGSAFSCDPDDRLGTSASKTWYGVPGYAASQFENTVLQHVYCNKILTKHGKDGAFKFLAQKTTMFPPNIMLQHDVEVYKAEQKPGEFIITFPRAYHAGFSHGFNCGEAVNFANGDWFPLGAAASRRYALLRMMPLIPYEELLCKEAMSVYMSSSVRSAKNKPEDTASYKSIMQPFSHLMQFYKTSLLRRKSSRNLPSSSNTPGFLLCGICHRDCYVAYLLCKYCLSHPICLFHGKTSFIYSFCFQLRLRCRLHYDLRRANFQFVSNKMNWDLMTCFFGSAVYYWHADIAPHTCICGRDYSIFKRNDIFALEEAAKSFQQVKECNDTFSLSSTCFCKRNECIKDLEDPWHEESVSETENALGAASKPKIKVADYIKHSVENKTTKHWRNDRSAKGTNRPEIIYNLRKRKSDLIL